MPARIRILSDGKPGHVNQSIGLAQALARRADCSIEVIDLTEESGRIGQLSLAAAIGPEGPPTAIIAAGHGTHLPLYWASKVLKSQTVVIMQPTLSFHFFDHLLIPEHDLSKVRKNVIPTKGALNRMSEDPGEKTATGLLLIGGESKHATWEPDPLLDAIHSIVSSRSDLAWTATDSRRTPEGFLNQVEKLGLEITLQPASTCSPEWLPTTLDSAREAWVTPDSASMINEALTARCAVGILPLPQRDTKVSRGVVKQINSHFITPYSSWKMGEPLTPPAEPFHEAARCAAELIDRGLLRQPLS